MIKKLIVAGLVAVSLFTSYTALAEGQGTVRSNSNRLEIISPNGGEILTFGNTYEIRWGFKNTSRNESGDAVIRLLGASDNAIICYLGSAPASTGSFTFTLNSMRCDGGYLIPGSYRAEVKTAKLWDVSDNYFNVVPTITVTSPNGGETYQVGSPMRVMWNQSGLETYVLIINLLKYSDAIHHDGGTTITAHANSAGEGGYEFIIPSSIAPGSMYKISVGGGSANDISDNFFTILPGQSSITVTSPKYSSTITMFRGGDYRVTWQAYGTNYVDLLLQTESDGGLIEIPLVSNVPASNGGNYGYSIVSIPDSTPFGFYTIVVRSTTNSSLYGRSTNIQIAEGVSP